MHEGKFWNEYDGRAHLFPGLQIKKKSDGIFINQAKCTKEFIKKFELKNAKVRKTSMATTTKHDKDE